MAILIGIWELLLVLSITVALTLLASRRYWKQRLVILHQQQEVEIRRLIKEFKHQASHCLRPIQDNMYLIKKKMKQQPVTNTSEWSELVSESLLKIEKYEWRLTRLIENMSFTSHLEALDISLRFSEVKPEVIASDALKEFNDWAEEKGVILTWWARPEEFPRITANEESLRQALINLIDNAIKYCEEKDEIDLVLEASESKKVILIRVSDTGPGIPEEDWELIFDRGYRVEDARGRKPREGSQGLGLYIVKLVVERHGGVINVTSELGKGTTFSITLPIHRN
jgi:signal transduction histidine kinase